MAFGKKIFKVFIVFFILCSLFLPISGKVEAQSTNTCDTNSAVSCLNIANAFVTDKYFFLYFDVLNKENQSVTLKGKISLSPYNNSVQGNNTNIQTIQTADIVIPSSASLQQNIKLSFGKGFGNNPDIDLTPNTNYHIELILEKTTNQTNSDGITESFTFEVFKYYTNTLTKTVDDTSVVGSQYSANVGTGNGADGGFDFKCKVLTTNGQELAGCVAWLLYYVIWSPLAYFAELAGHFLDYFIFYSTNSSAYDKSFISGAWGAVRDIANIFFIIALLYVSIKTILGLAGGDGKRIIKNVIIFALIINFSLYFTRVVVDASNILAKVFYNNIEVKNEPYTGEKPKSLSVGLVSKFNPQEIIDKKTYASENKDGSNNVGLFIFVTLLSSIISGFMIYIFISTGILFVARVAGIWIAMIFAPIAFASYALPFNIPGVGGKEWWSDLWKNAFLAPIFIFFLYIIFLFGDLFKLIGIDFSSTDSVAEKAMTVIVPFAIIFVLLQKAKKVAVDYSGTIGSTLSSAGAAIGGFAVGAATGGLAVAGRASFGRLGTYMANSDSLKAAEAKGGFGGFFAKRARNVGTFASTSSFDLRSAKVAGKTLASTGLTSLGTAQQGGFKKEREDIVSKRQKRMKELELGENSNKIQNVRNAENEVDRLKSDKTTKDNIAKAETEIKKAEEALQVQERKLKDEIDKFGGNSRQAAIQRGIRDLAINKVKTEKDTLKVIEKGIKDAEKFLKDAQNEVINTNRDRREDYAKNITSGWSNTINYVLTRNNHSYLGEREAANRIRAGKQDEKK